MAADIVGNLQRYLARTQKLDNQKQPGANV
jgi:hypothetical protein